MLWVDTILAASFLLGLSLTGVFFSGFVRDRNKRALAFSVLTFVFAVIPAVVLVSYALEFIDGEIPVWSLLLAAPVVLIVLGIIFRNIIRRMGREGKR